MNKLKSSLLVIAASVFISAPTYAADIEACLITKTDINPFFVKMKEGAESKEHHEMGVKLINHLLEKLTVTTRLK